MSRPVELEPMVVTGSVLTRHLLPASNASGLWRIHISARRRTWFQLAENKKPHFNMLHGQQ